MSQRGMELGSNARAWLGDFDAIAIVKKKWAIPLLWSLSIWESVALTTRRWPSISKTASRHQVLAAAALLALWRHFRAHEEASEAH